MSRPDSYAALQAWLNELRDRSGLTHDQLAEAVGGKTERQQTIRWLKKGQVPSGYSFFKLLTALGVKMDPPPPDDVPLAVNAELRALRVEVAEVRAELRRLAAQTG